MNILMINQSDAFIGGSDTYFRDICLLLKSKGHNVYEFYSTVDKDKENIYPSSIDFESPKVSDFIKYCYNWEAKSKLNNFIMDKEIDIAHINIYYGKLTSSILSVLENKNIPIVQTLHEYKLVCPVYTLINNGKECYSCKGNRFYNAVINKCNRNSVARSILSCAESYISVLMGSQRKIDKFICVSAFQRNKMEEMGINHDKLVTIHNFLPEYKKNKNITCGEEYFLYLGRVEIDKGIKIFLEIAKRRPEFKFVVVGDGMSLNYAIEQKEKHKIDNIEFIGKVESNKVNDYIKRSIALIVPSLAMETFGLVVLEAFNYAKPVIASKQGGMTETVVDYENGFLKEKGDVEGFIDAVDLLGNNHQLAKSMGYAGYIHLTKNFSENIFYNKLIGIYKEVINA